MSPAAHHYAHQPNQAAYYGSQPQYAQSHVPQTPAHQLMHNHAQSQPATYNYHQAASVSQPMSAPSYSVPNYSAPSVSQAHYPSVSPEPTPPSVVPAQITDDYLQPLVAGAEYVLTRELTAASEPATVVRLSYMDERGMSIATRAGTVTMTWEQMEASGFHMWRLPCDSNTAKQVLEKEKRAESMEQILTFKPAAVERPHAEIDQLAQKLTEAARVKEELEAQNSQLEFRARHAEGQAEVLRKRVEAADAALNVALADKQELAQAHSDALRLNSELRLEASKFGVEMQAQHRAIEELNSRIVACDTLRLKAEDEANKHSAELKKLRREWRPMGAPDIGRDMEADASKKRIEQLEGQVRALRTQVADLEGSAKKATEAADERHKAWETIRDQMQSQEEANKKEAAKREESIKNLQKQQKEKDADWAKRAKQVEDAETTQTDKISNLLQIIKELKVRLDEARDARLEDIEEVEKDAQEDAEKKQRKHKADIAKLEAKLVKAQADAHQAEVLKTKVAAKEEELKRALAELEEAKEGRAEDATRLKGKIASLTQDVAKKQSASEVLREANDQATYQQTQLKSKITDLEFKLDNGTRKLEQAEEHHTDTVGRLQKDLDAARQKESEARTQLHAETTKRRQAEVERDNSRQELSEARSTQETATTTAKERTAAAEAKARGLQQEVDTLSLQNAKMQGQAEEARTAIQQVKTEPARSQRTQGFTTTAPPRDLFDTPNKDSGSPHKTGAGAWESPRRFGTTLSPVQPRGTVNPHQQAPAPPAAPQSGRSTGMRTLKALRDFTMAWCQPTMTNALFLTNDAKINALTVSQYSTTIERDLITCADISYMCHGGTPQHTRPALHAMRGIIVRAIEEGDQLRAAIAYCTAYETVAVGRKKDQSQDEKDKLLRIRWFRLVVTQLYTADFADAGTTATARAMFDVIMSQPLATLQLSTHVIGSKPAETISLSSAYTSAVPNVLASASAPNDNAPNAVKVGDTQPKGRRGGGDTTEAQRLLFNRTVEAVDHAGRVALLRVTGEWVRTEVLNTDPKNRRLRIRHIVTDDDGDDAREPAQWMSETELNADYTAAKAWSWGEKLEGTQGESIVPTAPLSHTTTDAPACSMRRRRTRSSPRPPSTNSWRP
jgi:hypothetical protein